MTVEAPLTLRKRIARGAFAGMNRPDCCVPGCDLDGPAPKRPDCNCYMEAEMIADAIIAAIGEEWRPISEAPRDGTTILVASARGDVGEAYYGIGRGWQHIVGSRLGQKMTHWRPLPPAPSPSPPPLGDA